MEIKNVEIGEIKGCIYERRHTNTEQFKELVRSVKQQGLIEPVIVRKANGGYEVIAGWQRFLACKEAGMTTIEVKDYNEISKTDAMLVSVAENVIGVDVNAMDVAYQLSVIKENTNWNDTTIAVKCGKNQTWVSRHLSLLKQSNTVQKAVEKDEISEGQARELKKVKDDDIDKVVKQVKNKTVEDTKKIIKEYIGENNQKTEIEKTREDIEYLNCKISEVEKTEEKISDLTDRIEEKEKKIKEIDLNIPKDLNGLVKKRREIEERYFPLIEEMKQLEGEIEILNGEIKNVNIKELRNKEEQLNTESDKIKVKIGKIREQLEELRNELAPLSKVEKEIREQIKEYEQKEAIIGEKNIKYSRLKNKVDNLYARHENDIKDYEGLKIDTKRGEQANEKIKKLSFEIGELKGEKRKLQTFGNNKAKWLQKREELTTKLQEIEGEKGET